MTTIAEQLRTISARADELRAKSDEDIHIRQVITLVAYLADLAAVLADAPLHGYDADRRPITVRR